MHNNWPKSTQPDQGVQVADAVRGMPLRRRSSPQTRGVDSAALSMLPRLPDTAEELQSIAAALEADPSRVLHLGLEANEQVVKTQDLSKYRIVVFATHGLAPGDLDGLTQPALALISSSLSRLVPTIPVPPRTSAVLQSGMLGIQRSFAPSTFAIQLHPFWSRILRRQASLIPERHPD